jgi:hypothetical protein
MFLVGGNSVDKAPSSRVQEFVKSHGGHTVITKVRQPLYAFDLPLEWSCDLFLGCFWDIC